MSEPEKPQPGPGEEVGDEPSAGPNLKLIYGLIALALVIAIAVAALIVMPFYMRR